MVSKDISPSKSFKSTGILHEYRYEYPYLMLDQSLFAMGKG